MALHGSQQNILFVDTEAELPSYLTLPEYTNMRCIDTEKTYALIAGVWELFSDPNSTAPAHATSHQNGGADEISVAGLSGLLADAQVPLAHTHAAGDVTSGQFAMARLASGTPDGTKYVRDDGTLVTPSAGGAASATTVETDIGSTAKFTGKFTITDAAISGTSKVLCWQAPGPYTGKGTRADEAEMQPVQVIAVEPAAGSAVVKWQTPPYLTMSPSAEPGGTRDAVGATFDRVINQILPAVANPKRLGKVRGNVKFSYMVMS